MADEIDYAALEARILGDFCNWLHKSGRAGSVPNSAAEMAALYREYSASKRTAPIASAVSPSLWPLKYGMGATKLRHSTAHMTGQRPPFGNGDALGDRQRGCDFCGTFHPIGVLENGLCPSCCDLEEVQSLMDRDRE